MFGVIFGVWLRLFLLFYTYFFAFCLDFNWKLFKFNIQILIYLNFILWEINQTVPPSLKTRSSIVSIPESSILSTKKHKVISFLRLAFQSKTINNMTIGAKIWKITLLPILSGPFILSSMNTRKPACVGTVEQLRYLYNYDRLSTITTLFFWVKKYKKSRQKKRAQILLNLRSGIC